MKLILAIAVSFWPKTHAFSSTLLLRSPRGVAPGLKINRLAAATLDTAAPSEDGCSAAATVFNTCKSVMGAGAIALPASICAIGDVKGAAAPAVAILSIMGFLSGYTFSMIGTECARHDAKDFDDLWSKTIGPDSKWVIGASITSTTFLACISYAMIIGDLYSALAVTAGLTGLPTQRNACIVAVTLAVVSPLCFLKSLAALAPFSLLGVLGIIFSAGITGVRYLDGSYLPGGKFYKGLIATPSFGAVQNGWKIDQMAFVLLSCLGTAFLGHFNAPSFYNELKDKSVKKFNQVVGTSFSITTLVYAALMTFGFGTFGTATLGNIFVNYHKADTLALLCRVAMCVAITFSYPVLFMALKTSISPLLKVDKSDVKKQTLLTVTLLTLCTGLGMVLDDLGFVAAVTGAVMGSLIIYVFPALFKLKSLQKLGRPFSAVDTASTYGILGLGGILGVVGVTVSFLKQFTKVLG